MTLKEQITQGIKEAMKAKDEVKKNILRVIKAEISREEGGLKDLDDTAVIKLIKKNIKSLDEIGDEGALAEKAVLEVYLPQQMSEAEITKALEEIIASTGASSMQDMGKVMGAFNAKYVGLADGGTVSGIVKAKLA
jgi:uncharacterized protein YqeY